MGQKLNKRNSKRIEAEEQINRKTQALDLFPSDNFFHSLGHVYIYCSSFLNKQVYWHQVETESLNFKFWRALNTGYEATGEQSITFRTHTTPPTLQTLDLGNKGSCFLHRVETDVEVAHHFRNTTTWHGECCTGAWYSQRCQRILCSLQTLEWMSYWLNQVKRTSCLNK